MHIQHMEKQIFSHSIGGIEEIKIIKYSEYYEVILENWNQDHSKILTSATMNIIKSEFNAFMNKLTQVEKDK